MFHYHLSLPLTWEPHWEPLSLSVDIAVPVPVPDAVEPPGPDWGLDRLEEEEEEEEAEEAEAEAEEAESEVEEAVVGGQHSGGRWKTSSLPSMTTRRGSHTICVLRIMLHVEGRRNVCM